LQHNRADKPIFITALTLPQNRRDFHKTQYTQFNSRQGAKAFDSRQAVKSNFALVSAGQAARSAAIRLRECSASTERNRILSQMRL